MTPIWIILLSGLLADTPPLLQPAATVQLPIELIEAESRKVAYVEHTGAYWSLGSVIDTVARDARAVGSRGKLLIRYLSSPAGPPGVVHAQVGYELTGRDLPKPPYLVAEWPRSLVVTKTIPGADGLSPRHQAALKSWVSNEGLVPSGDFIAIVELAENGGSTAIEQVRIQMTVCSPDPPSPEPVADVVPALTAAIALDIQPADSTVTRVITLPSRQASEKAEELNIDNPIEPPPIAVIPPQPVPPPTKAKVETQQPPLQPTVDIRQLIEHEAFDELALVLLPSNVDSASRLWMEELIGRVIALTNGVRKLAPGDEGWLVPLSTELAARRDQLRTSGTKTPRRVIGPATPAKDRTAERRFVILEIDRLMAGLAYGSLTPDKVREKLTEILEAAPTLITLY